MSNLYIFLCIIFWGISTFLNRLAVEKMPAPVMQAIVGFIYLFYIPIALKLSNINPFNYNWSISSVCLTAIATCISIVANILLYSSLKGNAHTGASTMLIALYPVVTLILSAIFLHEHFSNIKIAGVVAMIVGTILLSI